jgi:hypothetical protein
VWGILCKPFDVRFQRTLEKISLHQEILQKELDWLKLEALGKSTSLTQAIIEETTAREDHNSQALETISQSLLEGRKRTLRYG